MTHKDIILRCDTAKKIREIRASMRNGRSMPDYVPDDMASEIEYINSEYNKSRIDGMAVIAFILACVALFCIFNGCAHAEDIAGHDVNTWANAIYKAEGGKHTRHPYGVLAHYKHTTPRQACINTIRHQYHNWLKKGRPREFLAYLGHIYCPVGALNDPWGLNRNWIKNVSGAL